MHDLWNNQNIFSAVVSLWLPQTSYTDSSAMGMYSYLWTLYRDGLGREYTDIHMEKEARVTGRRLPSGEQWHVSSSEIDQVWLELYELDQADQAALAARVQELVTTIKLGGN